MVFLNIFTILINLMIVIFSFLILKNRFDRRYLNKNILSEVKKEINNLIINLNETAVNSVSLSENKIEELKKILNQADIKISQMEDRLKNIERKEVKIKTVKLEDADTEKNLISSNVYSPERIINKSSKKQTENEEKQRNIKIELELENTQLEQMTVKEKIVYLDGKGLKPDEIRSRLSLDEGEFEFLLNIEGINLSMI